MPLFGMSKEAVIASCKTIIDKTDIDRPHVVNRVTDRLPPPTECPCCGGSVSLVNNCRFYGGREYGWPLAYACRCGARVGCHPKTTVPLGTLADADTMEARRQAHIAFDPLWRNRGPGMRGRAYRALSKAMGVERAHISWMGADQCRKIVEICAAGLKV